LRIAEFVLVVKNCKFFKRDDFLAFGRLVTGKMSQINNAGRGGRRTAAICRVQKTMGKTRMRKRQEADVKEK
jgi:hypothetical protein